MTVTMTCNHDQTHDHRHDCDHDLHDHDDYRLTFDVVNPYSEALIESVANCGAAETDLAIGKVIFYILIFFHYFDDDDDQQGDLFL